MKRAYTNGIVLDGSAAMEPRTGLTIFTDRETIEAVEDSKASTAGYEVVDLGGAYVMPGLINLHAHLPASGKPKKKESNPRKTARLITSCAPLRAAGRKLCENYARMELMSGVTTLRTVGGVADFDTQVRDRTASGKAAGPRIIASNMAVSVPKGHMAGTVAYEASSATDARELVRRIAADKPDLIKLMITGGVLDATVRGEPGVLRMPPDYVRAACDEAHALGFKVAAHVESPEGVRVALENGVDTIEHGAKPNDAILALFRKREAALVTTLSPAVPFALMDPSLTGVSEMAQYNGKLVFDGIVACARACLKAGIPVGLGTDTGCPFVTHYDMWRELWYFQKYCGVSAAFALYTATQQNAAIAGLSAITGTIAPGMCADFIATRTNPLDDLTALRNIELVVSRGQAFPKPHVKKIPEVEQALDHAMGLA